MTESSVLTKSPMATHVRMTLAIRNGSFNTIAANLQGATTIKVAVKSILALIQNDSPLLTRAVMADILNRTLLSRTRNTVRAELDIGSDLRAVTTGTIDALTHLIGADAIAELPADDSRRQPLQNMNRALARQDLSLDVEIDQVEIPRIDRLAMAPQARLDCAWAGEMILRVTNWKTELTMIEGRSDEHDRVKIDLKQHPQRFNDLFLLQAPFLRVIEGHGRINSAGLRILKQESLDRLEHNDLPEALQLHFAKVDGFT